MKQFTLPLDNETQRPITFLQNWHGLDAMIDTGSLFPVWVDDEKFLSKLDAEVVIDHVEFGGFGGSAEGRLYVIPAFQFGELIYRKSSNMSTRAKRNRRITGDFHILHLYI